MVAEIIMATNHVFPLINLIPTRKIYLGQRVSKENISASLCTNCPQASKRKLRSRNHGSQNRGENEIDSLLALAGSKSQDFINMLSLLLPHGKQETLQVLLDSSATTNNYLGEHVASKGN